jgi:hypothetical protein
VGDAGDADQSFQDGGALFITFDEGTTNDGCCRFAAGGHIVTMVISPLGKPHYQSSIPVDHYSLLRTMGDYLISGTWPTPLPHRWQTSFRRASPAVPDLHARHRWRPGSGRRAGACSGYCLRGS